MKGSGGVDGPFVSDVIEQLAAARQTVAVAESLTGGAVVEALTAPPGASAVVRGGVVAYATDLKATLVGVDPELLDRVGPVHPDVAWALAVGIRQRCASTFGLAVTGVAGPSPQHGHPVGEVHVALVGPGVERRQALDLAAAGGRSAIRAAARDACLVLLARTAVEHRR